MLDMLDDKDRLRMGRRIRALSTVSVERLQEWIRDRGGSINDINKEIKQWTIVLNYAGKWLESRKKLSKNENELLKSAPSSGRCESLGRLKVLLPEVSPILVQKSSLVMRSAYKEERNNALSQQESQSLTKSSGIPSKERTPNTMTKTLSRLLRCRIWDSMVAKTRLFWSFLHLLGCTRAQRTRTVTRQA